MEKATKTPIRTSRLNFIFMSDTVNVATQYNVIIDSIGTANPAVSSILADVLGTPIEIVAKSLYNAPSVLFTDIEEELAEKTVELLGKLGIDSHHQTNDLPLPDAGEQIDIGIYVHDLDKLPEVAHSLSEFLGCGDSEALNLLMNDPAIVLGGVSHATGIALSERIDAEVIISEPKNDFYTLVFDSTNEMIKSQLESYLKYNNIAFDFSESTQISDLDYHTATKIWSGFQSTGMLKMINQSFQRFEIILESVDTSNPNYRSKLTDETGMPDEVIDQVIDSLPVQLESSVNRKFIADKLNDYAAAGLTCTAIQIKQNAYKLIIEENADLEKSKSILSQFLPSEKLPSGNGRWESPIAVGDLIFRVISTQLEDIGCMVDYEYM